MPLGTSVGNTLGTYWELNGNSIGNLKGTCWEQRKNEKNPPQFPPPNLKETRAMSHCGLAFYIKKYLKAKEEL
jgi:hypothetical protein